MTIGYNQMLGLWVLTVKTGRKICKIKNFVIDTNSGKFLGLFCIKPGFIMTTKYFIKAEKIKNFGKNAVMVEDEKSLEELHRNKIAASIIKEKIKIKGNHVLTEDGHHLGKVKNYEVDLISNKLSKIIVSGNIFQNLFRGELIIPQNQILSIGRDAIIVKNQTITQVEENTEKIKTEKELANLPTS